MKKVLYVLLAIMALPIITNLLTGGFKKHQPQETPQPTAQQIADHKEQEEHDEAQEHVKSFITKTLKAPSTAKFPPYSEIPVVKKDGYWESYTYVDAQNSFGAMIRTNYYVKMQNLGTVWRLVEISDGHSTFNADTPKETETTTSAYKPVEQPKKVYRSTDANGNVVFSDTPR